MANLRCEIQPDSNDEVTRLARRQIYATVHTWRTFAHVHLNADGSGYVQITRDGSALCETINFNGEVKE